MLYSKCKGLQNENELVEYFNNKRVNELNPMAYEFIKTLFKDVNANDKIITTKRLDKGKCDFLLTINNITKSVSVKSGSRNSVHLEPLGNFVNYLRKIGINERIIKLFIKFHYADNTMDGTGTNRLSVAEYKEKFQNELDEINNYFNTNDIITKIVRRAILEGVYYDNVDIILYGNISDFLWITKDEILNICTYKKDEYSTGVHFGPLFCQPWNRNLKFDQKYEYQRNYVQIKWYSLIDDIIKVMSFYRKK